MVIILSAPPEPAPELLPLPLLLLPLLLDAELLRPPPDEDELLLELEEDELPLLLDAELLLPPPDEDELLLELEEDELLLLEDELLPLELVLELSTEPLSLLLPLLQAATARHEIAASRLSSRVE